MSSPDPQEDMSSFMDIMDILGKVFNTLSILCLIYLLIIMHKYYSNHVTVKVIRIIAIVTLIQHAETLVFFFGFQQATIQEKLATQMIFLTCNSQAILWSFCLAYLSYKIILTVGKIDKERFYKRYWIVSGIAILAYLSFLIYFEVNIQNLQRFKLFGLIFFMPIQSLVPIASIYLYIRQSFFARKLYIGKFEQFNININKLILYPIFEMICFGSSLLDMIFALLGQTEATLPKGIIGYITLAQATTGMLQLILFFKVRTIATREFDFNLKKEPIQIQIPEDLSIDRGLSIALRDE